MADCVYLTTDDGVTVLVEDDETTILITDNSQCSQVGHGVGDDQKQWVRTTVRSNTRRGGG